MSKFSFLSLNFHFWGKNYKNDNKAEFLDFYKVTLYMILEISRQVVIIGIAIFKKLAKFICGVNS